MPRRLLALLAIALPVALPVHAAEKLSYPDLVGRLTDLEYVATLPAIIDGKLAEKCEQWSSYDRASKFDAATGKYLKWDANGDGGGIIRREDAPPGFYPEGSTEKQVQVFAEIRGPGVIWRTWSAKPEKGRGAENVLSAFPSPSVEVPFSFLITPTRRSDSARFPALTGACPSRAAGAAPPRAPAATRPGSRVREPG